MSITTLIEQTQDSCEHLDFYVVKYKDKILQWLGIPTIADIDNVFIEGIHYTYEDVRLHLSYNYRDLDDDSIEVVNWLRCNRHVLTYDELLTLLMSEA